MLKIINSCVYTLYLFSRYNKLSTHILIAGAGFFFIIYLNLMTIWKLVVSILGFDFASVFLYFRMELLFFILAGFILSQKYARHLIMKIKAGNVKIKKMRFEFIAYYYAASIVLLIIVMAFI